MSTLNKYNPKYCKVRPWADIQESYNAWFGGKYRDNLGKLIQHIISTGLSTRLFGLTSMDKLVIGIYDPIEWDRETLHITFDTKNKEWHFIYYALPFQQPEFVRTYSAETGIEKFDSFIKMIRW